MGLKKLFKKVTKPISKVLDKIVPNEIKPALPYLSAFAPFMMGPGIVGATGFQGALANPWLRAAMAGGLNLGSQLSQEGSEGELSGISALLAAGTGFGTAAGAPGKLGSWKSDMSDFAPERSFLQKARDVGITGAEKASEFLTGAGETIRDPSAWGLNKETLGAFATPISQGTGDLALAVGQRALRDYENEMANQDQLSLIDDDGRRRAIRAAMEAAGHLEEIIVDTLAELGLKKGGIVGLKHGGQLVKRGPGRPGYGGKKYHGVGDEKENWLALRREFMDQGFSMGEAGSLASAELGYHLRDLKAKGGRISKEGGGVASVLPKGKEADYRGGGVIPVGSRERADDVPARLSKNEFVMTADAVRAAGGGSINKGAKRMYNLMHNLEARV